MYYKCPCSKRRYIVSLSYIRNTAPIDRSFKASKAFLRIGTSEEAVQIDVYAHYPYYTQTCAHDGCSDLHSAGNPSTATRETASLTYTCEILRKRRFEVFEDDAGEMHTWEFSDWLKWSCPSQYLNRGAFRGLILMCRGPGNWRYQNFGYLPPSFRYPLAAPTADGHCYSKVFPSAAPRYSSIARQNQALDLKRAILSSMLLQQKEEIMEFSLQQIPKRLLSLTKAIFSWTIVGIRQLNKFELFEALVLKDSPRASPIDVGNEELIQGCQDKFNSATAGFVQFDEHDRAHFIDDAAKHYITNGNSAFGITFPEAEENVALSCLDYFSRGDISADLKSPSKYRRSISIYEIEYGLTHYKNAEKDSQSLAAFLYRLMERQPEAIVAWGSAYSAVTGRTLHMTILSEPFALAAQFGLSGFAELLLNLGREPLVRVENITVAELAYMNGHSALAIILYCERQMARARRSLSPVSHYGVITGLYSGDTSDTAVCGHSDYVRATCS